MDVDPAAIGLPVAAYVRIRPAPGQLSKVAQLTVSMAHVSECHRISGEDCFLVKVHAATIEALEATLDAFLAYGQTVTSFVVSSPVPPRALEPGCCRGHVLAGRLVGDGGAGLCVGVAAG